LEMVQVYSLCSLDLYKT